MPCGTLGTRKLPRLSHTLSQNLVSLGPTQASLLKGLPEPLSARYAGQLSLPHQFPTFVK